MKFPNFNEEKKLWKQGIEYVVGLDEAGRGPLAGPVIAAAVCVKSQIPITNSQSNSKFPNARNVSKIYSLGLDWSLDIGHWGLGVNDSKKLYPQRRGELYEILTNHPAIAWGVGVVSEKVIDRINILEATKLAMTKAVKGLQTGFLLIDGNFGLQAKIPQKSIIKGDQKVFSIAAASIIAKVTRDRIMQKMHQKYPDYGFDRHKGYGTALHLKNIQQFGPCKIHRKTFFPMNTYPQTEIC